MGIEGILPERVLSKMDPLDRKKLGKAGRTRTEAQERNSLLRERDDHAHFINFCCLKGIGYDHSHPGKRATNKVGTPDFALYYPVRRTLFIEFKIRPNKLTREQEEIKREREAAGFKYVVAYSLSEAIEAAQNYLINARDE
jgi:hypothetical protein